MQNLKPSPFAPSSYPDLPPVAGVKLAVGNSGTRYKGRPDVLWAQMCEGTTVAGVYTRSLTASASVLRSRANSQKGAGRVLVVNAGNSNAFTGQAGETSVSAIEAEAARIAGVPPDQVLTASTGVIGQILPHEKIIALFNELHDSANEGNWLEAATAITTTDTFNKLATRQCTLGGKPVTLNGFAKGSGMIAPDMATMLAFLFTDAALPAPVLQALLTEANEASFNRITVDSDTSTSDMALIFATGQAGNTPPKNISDPELSSFKKALNEVMLELAHAIVKDGEGASKFITIEVTGAEHDDAAKRIALSIANSPLVKTAIAGEDANWGRIVMAVGKAGEKADRDRLTINIGGLRVASHGQVDPDYREEALVPHMKGREINISVDLGLADGNATVFTCDLTHGYIDINADYRS